MKGGKSKADTKSSKLAVNKKPAKASKAAAAAKDPNKPKRPSSAFFEKAPYVAKAGTRKVDYEKNMKAYNKKLEEGPKEDEEESDKSVSEVNDEDDADDGSDEEEDDD
ncbi:hypothetical protein F2Q69_00027169 [Brassica cretica]|uniref:HMG box domain-containing protein n=1 Tax=Brassica cretica TaxID=69181 RepID=A0A8S9S3F4_BRACR|nr:hypothetical protein F2Q69_00027169 [Brassica cretica]